MSNKRHAEVILNTNNIPKNEVCSLMDTDELYSEILSIYRKNSTRTVRKTLGGFNEFNPVRNTSTKSLQEAVEKCSGALHALKAISG